MARSAIPQHRYAAHGADPAAIQSAIDAEDVLAFSYPSSVDGSMVRRTLSPWRIENDVILKGYDHGREEVRRYDIGKIEDPEVDLADEWVRPE